MTKLFVSGFPLEITEIELAMMIAPHGDISTVKIVRDRQTGKCKGYAFVEMASLRGAEDAVIALDGIEMNDRELTVRIAENKPEGSGPASDTFMRNPIRPFSKGQFPSRRTPDSGDRLQRPRRPRL